MARLRLGLLSCVPGLVAATRPPPDALPTHPAALMASNVSSSPSRADAMLSSAASSGGNSGNSGIRGIRGIRGSTSSPPTNASTPTGANLSIPTAAASLSLAANVTLAAGPSLATAAHRVESNASRLLSSEAQATGAAVKLQAVGGQSEVKLQGLGDGYDFDRIGNAPSPPMFEQESDVLRSENKVLIIWVIVCFPLVFWIMLCFVARKQIHEAFWDFYLQRTPKSVGQGWA